MEGIFREGILTLKGFHHRCLKVAQALGQMCFTVDVSWHFKSKTNEAEGNA